MNGNCITKLMKTLSFGIVFWLLSLGLITAVQAATVQNENELRAAVEDVSGEVTVELDGNIELTSAITISNQAKVTIIGNGYTITLADGVTDRHFYVYSKSSLTIRNVTLQGNPRMEDNISTENGGVHVHDSSFTMEDGAIIKDCTGYYGGGVTILDGSINMMDSEISNCKANLFGGGVFIGDGSFAMKNSKIVGCIADAGGGIGAQDTRFVITAHKLSQKSTIGT